MTPNRSKGAQRAPNHCRTQQNDPNRSKGAQRAPNRCRRPQNDPKAQQNTAERPQSGAERSKTTPKRRRTPQDDPRALQNAAKRPQSVAERRKTTPNHCRTQQNDPRALQNPKALQNDTKSTQGRILPFFTETRIPSGTGETPYADLPGGSRGGERRPADDPLGGARRPWGYDLDRP